jgi:hypothetical protein
VVGNNPEMQQQHTDFNKTGITSTLVVLEVPRCSLRMVCEKPKHVRACNALIDFYFF